MLQFQRCLFIGATSLSDKHFFGVCEQVIVSGAKSGPYGGFGRYSKSNSCSFTIDSMDSLHTVRYLGQGAHFSSSSGAIVSQLLPSNAQTSLYNIRSWYFVPFPCFIHCHIPKKGFFLLNTALNHQHFIFGQLWVTTIPTPNRVFATVISHITTSWLSKTILLIFQYNSLSWGPECTASFLSARPRLKSANLSSKQIPCNTYQAILEINWYFFPSYKTY